MALEYLAWRRDQYKSNSCKLSERNHDPFPGTLALFASLRRAPQLVVLHHFCGLHSRLGGPMSGPSELMKSLVVQLILHLDQFHGILPRFKV
jgi:hypothetical protein